VPKFPPSPISPARLVAFDVLLAVEGGSYASDDLRLRSVTLSGRDAGLAAQIVFGCLRFQNQLDYLIGKYSGRKVIDLDPAVKIALRGAIFQIRYLERVPAHAAVDNSVEFVKKRQRAATGLANAVLRKVNRDVVRPLCLVRSGCCGDGKIRSVRRRRWALQKRRWKSRVIM